MADEKPIIVIKKKGGHGGHHGGAWKVAYADFVTAMMAFFMVMWLVNTAETTVRKNIAQYFRRPGIFDQGSGAPLLTGDAGFLEGGVASYKRKDKSYTVGNAQLPMKMPEGAPPKDDDTAIEERRIPKGLVNADEKLKGYGGVDQPMDIETDPTTKDMNNKLPSVGGPEKAQGEKEAQEEQMEELMEQLRKQMESSPELQALLGQVEMTFGEDGLHIEIMDTDKTSMFALGSARVSPEADAAFEKIAALLAKLPNTLEIVGHTDGKPFSSANGGYSNWELSADRANAARRLLEKGGVAANRITKVQGKADRELKKPEDPFAAANRRITLIMHYPVNGKIDLGKDPDAFSHLPTKSLSPAQPANIKNNPGSQRAYRLKQKTQDGQKEKEKEQVLTTKDMIKQGNKQRTQTITLPDETGPGDMHPFIGKDLIFKDSPVLGPPTVPY